jgi:imidazolonepropionase-like amidohydrolase
MNRTRRRLAFLSIMACGLLFACAPRPRTAPPPPALVFKDVAVFDGLTLIPRCTVVVRGPNISAVGTDIAVPEGAEVVSGRGLTLLPGLIDAHVHAFSPGDLRRSLMFGVTTVMDMTTTPGFMNQVKAYQSADGNPGMAELFSAGVAATVPGGHGTEHGVDLPTLTEPGEAAAFVAARKAEGSDYIKIMSGMARRVLSRETVAALASEARKQGLMSVVHVNVRKYALEAIEAGVNGLAHCFADLPPGDDLIALMRARNAFVIPTLSVMTDLADAKSVDLAGDPSVAPYLPPEILAALNLKREQMSNIPDLSYRVAEENARLFHAAGIRVLAGSDSGNPGTVHGPSLHGELELLVIAGMKPAAALAAATSVPADVFGLKDRGRIAPGRRADLFLVRGNPVEDITAARDIAGVWKLGRRLDRESHRARMAVLQAAWRKTGKLPPDGSESGWISDFDSGDYFTRFGFVWFPTNDSGQGGKSRASISLAAAGAENTAGCLSVTGMLKPGSPMPWAGAAFYPGPTVWTCADLSAWSALSFWARGDGGKAVVLFILRGKRMPTFRFFDIGDEWRRYEFPFSGMGGSDGTDILTMAVGAAQAEGPFRLEIDQVRLIRSSGAE